MNLYDLPCVAEGCDRTLKHSSSELCGRCYQRDYKSGDKPVLAPCVVEGCRANESFRGACVKHRAEVHPEVRFPRRVGKWQNPDGSRKTCTAEDCQEGAEARGLCREHYSRSVYIPKGRSNTPGGIRIKCTWGDFICPEYAYARTLCEKHYKQQKFRDQNSGLDAYKECPVTGCGRRMVQSGVICAKCNQFRWRYNLSPEDVLRMHLPENRSCQNPGVESLKTSTWITTTGVALPGSFPPRRKSPAEGACGAGSALPVILLWGCYKKTPGESRGFLTI